MNGDSGHNSSRQSSPTSSLPDNKPRTRAHRPGSQSSSTSSGVDTRGGRQQPRRQSDKNDKSDDNVTYADLDHAAFTKKKHDDVVNLLDLDPKAFMKNPKNRVLPPMATVSSSKSTYASVSVSRSQLV